MFGKTFGNKQSTDPMKRGMARSSRVGEISEGDDRLQ